MHIYIYIYTERERERSMHMCIYTSVRTWSCFTDTVSYHIGTSLGRSDCVFNQLDYPKRCPNPWRKRFLMFLPMLFALGVVVRFRAVLAENIILGPYGQQLLKLTCSWDRKSLEHARPALQPRPAQPTHP